MAVTLNILLFLNIFCLASSKIKRCEKINVPMCQTISYNLTYMPNMFNHSTQEEAALEVHQFWPLVELTICSPELQFFLCSMYAPVCQPNVTDEVLPCRSLCKRVKKGCEPLLRQYGFPWPERMRCRRFPEDRDDSLCLSGDRVEASTTTVRPTELTTTTKISNEKKSEKIKIPMFKNVGYKLTSFHVLYLLVLTTICVQP